MSMQLRKYSVSNSETRYDRLSGNAVSAVVDDDCAQSVESFDIGACVCLHSLQVTALTDTHVYIYKIRDVAHLHIKWWAWL